MTCFDENWPSLNSELTKGVSIIILFLLPVDTDV
jgi:hypothetical protein